MNYELSTQFDSRKSFYGKAKVERDLDGCETLFSYGTKVAVINKREAYVFGTYSQTTLRHIKEFLKQHGFEAETAKQIMKDYGVK
jgi:hypothetical protein